MSIDPQMKKYLDTKLDPEQRQLANRLCFWLIDRDNGYEDAAHIIVALLPKEKP
jgi:hypothetical protein